MIHELLNDRTYDIEFNGHLTNHAKHAVVALAGLGAAPEKIKAYYDNYARLTPYGFGLEPPLPARHEISEANWQDLLGKRSSFWQYCEFFDRQEKELGLDEMLRQYLPRLLPGWVGSFTHAAIHLGWGLDAGSRWMTIEGLAYLAFSYVSCHPERSVPVATGGAVDSLLDIATAWEAPDGELRQHVERLTAETTEGIHPELVRSGLQYRIARLLGEGHPLIYRTPQDLSWEELYYAATLLYLAVPGDFVLLHLITSLHAMEQIAEHLPVDQRNDVLRYFWIGMLCIALAGAEFPKRSKLEALHSTFADAVDGDGADRDWEHIIARAVEEEEEHNPKLVYVSRRMWTKAGKRSIYRAAAGQFTATPELPQTFEEPPAE